MKFSASSKPLLQLYPDEQMQVCGFASVLSFSFFTTSPVTGEPQRFCSLVGTMVGS